MTPDSTGVVRNVLHWISGVSFYKLSLLFVVFYCLWVFLLVLSFLGRARHILLTGARMKA